MVDENSPEYIQKIVEEFVKHHELETSPEYRFLDPAADDPSQSYSCTPIKKGRLKVNAAF